MPTADKKRIAKNTLALYVRMIFVMAVMLYTSRIILEKLGVTEFGIYSSVGSVVGMLAFLNGTLSIGTSRFLTFELGKGDFPKLKETFSTAFYTHLALACLVALILVLGGTWFVLNKLIIPTSLKTAALITFYISVFTAFINITQVPYTSLIIAHENMKIYAYIGIFEAVAKLGVAFAISLAPIQKLVWYAILIALVQISTMMVYRIYCMKKYTESVLSRVFRKDIFKKMLGFSGWNLIANVAQVFSTQGIIVVINMFFAPAVAAAQAVGNQVGTALTQFATNFTTALNPQIIKLYAANERAASRQLNLQSTVFVWDLMLLIGLPLIVCMNPIIHLWLVDVPPYAVIFAKFIVASHIIGVFSMTFYTPMIASGQLKWNAMACLIFSFSIFVTIYILLKVGFSVMWVQYLSITLTIIFSFFVKPFILINKIEYSFAEIAKCYFNCFKSALIPVIICIIIAKFLNIDNWLSIILAIMLIVAFVIFSSFICMERQVRTNLISVIRKKIHI